MFMDLYVYVYLVGRPRPPLLFIVAGAFSLTNVVLPPKDFSAERAIAQTIE
jgi:hypothetical protein